MAGSGKPSKKHTCGILEKVQIDGVKEVQGDIGKTGGIRMVQKLSIGTKHGI